MLQQTKTFSVKIGLHYQTLWFEKVHQCQIENCCGNFMPIPLISMWDLRSCLHQLRDGIVFLFKLQMATMWRKKEIFAICFNLPFNKVAPWQILKISRVFQVLNVDNCPCNNQIQWVGPWQRQCTTFFCEW
jgi:hypothetical protein